MRPATLAFAFIASGAACAQDSNAPPSESLKAAFDAFESELEAATAMGKTLSMQRIRKLTDVVDGVKGPGSVDAVRQGYAMAIRALAAIPGENAHNERFYLTCLLIGTWPQDEQQQLVRMREAHLLSREIPSYGAGNLLLELVQEETLRGSLDAAGNFMREYEERFVQSRPAESRFENQITTALGLKAALYLRLGLPDLAVDPINQQRARITDPKNTRDWGNNCFYRANLALARDDLAGLEALFAEFSADPRGKARAGGKFDGQIEIRLAMAEISAAMRGQRPAGTGRDRMAQWIDAEHIFPGERRRAVVWSVQSLLDESFAANTDDRSTLQSKAHALIQRFDQLLTPLRTGPTDVNGLMLDVQETRLAVARVSTLSPEAARELLHQRETVFHRLMERWKDTGSRDGGVGFLFFDDARALLSELIELSCAVLGEDVGAIWAVDRILLAQSHGSLAKALANTPALDAPTLSDVQSLLIGPGQGALLYLPGRSRSHLFTLEQAGVHHQRLPAKHVLDSLRDACNSGVARVLRESTPAAAAELEQALTKASAALLPDAATQPLQSWKSVAVVGIESIGRLPFELLPFATSRLGDERVVSYLPSLTVGVAMARRRNQQRATQATPNLEAVDMLLLGPPSHNVSGVTASPDSSNLWDDLPELPFGATQQESLLAPYPDSETHVVAGRGDALEHLGHTLDQARGLHVFTHSVDDADRPERTTGLLLSGPKGPTTLWAEEIETLQAPAVVMLTACRSGAAAARVGDDGRGNLGGSFLLAGADVVVLSHTPLEYHASLQAMTPVHRALGSAASVGEALLAARSRWKGMELNRTTLHPYLMHAVGLANTQVRDQPFQRRSTGSWMPWLAAGAGLALAVFLLRRSRTR